jgi:hypothetical protein
MSTLIMKRNPGVLAVTVVVAVVVSVLFGCWVSCAWAGFGIVPDSFTAVTVNQNGSVDRQAGSHPYEYRIGFTLNTLLNKIGEEEPEGQARSVEVNLPQGLVGNPTVVPRCPREDFVAFEAYCPGDTQIGIVSALIHGVGEVIIPVYNLVPPPGVPASFGFTGDSLSGLEEAAVRTGDGYGVRERDDSVPTKGLINVAEKIWGAPADATHNSERDCWIENEAHEKTKVYGCTSDLSPRPFLRLPTSCTGPLPTTIKIVSLEGEEAFAESLSREGTTGNPAGGEPAGLTGCESLEFNPVLSVQPETEGGEVSRMAEVSGGLNTELMIPQPETPEGLGEADLKEAVVTLPEGVTVSPSAAADGLAACPLGGPEGIDLTVAEKPHCPDASKLGTVEVQTPLLEAPLHGSVFLAQQGDLLGNGENPFGSLLAIYLSVEGEGVYAKIPGKIELDETTGQLTARFGGVKDTVTGEEYLPQLPYSKLKMSFFGGPNAPLILPAQCGTYTTTSKLTAWSSTPGHAVVAEPSSQFTISEGCTHAFNPSFTAGTTNTQAGAYTTFLTGFGRQDGEQRLKGLEETLPPGLLANIASVPVLCGNTEASNGECPQTSQLGTVTVHAGPGPDSLAVNGNLYLTGPYENSPFGIAVEVPAVAGPFNLNQNGGKTPITVRGAIHINSETAQATVTSDPFPELIPGTGVPTDIREVTVTLDRSGFTFNPTNCSPLNITATLTSTTGTNTNVSSPFQDSANCPTLPFKPVFTVSTKAQTSKANGASLTVTVASKPGQEANIAKVDLQIPKILPARLTTLQKACSETQFAVNPAGCPEGSVIATATAHTPILQAPLTGPGYLVSHGNAAFPDVEFVLQANERGGQVKIILDGKTNIKDGITYSRFETIPDAPVTTFTTNLPQGPHSALTTNLPPNKKYNLCGQNLTIPTTITGQNGATNTQTTHITIEGCTGVKATKTHKLTLTQQLQHALTQCHKHYKHNKTKRTHCEQQAHTHITTLALTTCHKQNPHPHTKQRHTCETLAHKHYDTKH